MNTRNFDEIGQTYVRDLGPEFGAIFHMAHAEWCHIWTIWHQFENLFDRNQERVELLNEAAGGFFAYVDQLFMEATILGICRLSDPPQSAGRDNLTVMRFLDFMDTTKRKQKMTTLLEAVKTATEFHRDWRNRRIGHNDLALKTKKANPLKPATRKGMNDAIKALHEVFNYINLEFRDSNFSSNVITYNDELSLLYKLYDARLFDEQQLKNLKHDSRAIIEYPEWLHHKDDNPF